MFSQPFSRENLNLYGEEKVDTTESNLWPAPVAPHPIEATVSLPGSKSLTARELIVSALATSPSVLRAPLHSRDSRAMCEALGMLGVVIEEIPGTGAFGNDVRVVPPAELISSTAIYCDQAGTVMRFTPPVATLALGPCAFDAHASAQQRPITELLQALRNLGADIRSAPGAGFAFTVYGTGGLPGGPVSIDASKSSQFVSALLLAGARFDAGIHLNHVGETLPSIPHIEMTIKTLEQRGVRVQTHNDVSWELAPQPLSGAEITIEPDLSNAAPFLAAALVTQGCVRFTDWPESTTQVGKELIPLLRAFGAEVSLTDGVLTVIGPSKLSGVELDLHEAGELAPTLIALAALSPEPSHITGIGHIRHHETDRITALCTQIQRLGGNITEEPDGVRIAPAKLHGGIWNTYHDHRMATAGALIGLVTNDVLIENVATTAKTLPEFTMLWEHMIHGTHDAHPTISPDLLGGHISS